MPKLHLLTMVEMKIIVATIEIDLVVDVHFATISITISLVRIERIVDSDMSHPKDAEMVTTVKLQQLNLNTNSRQEDSN